MTEPQDISHRLSSYYSLRKTDSEQADQLLSSLGASTEIDREIILELAAPKPLWQSDRFIAAHNLVVRGLEVLDRNGTRKVPVPRLGPLRPVVGYFVELVTKFIVRSHLRSITLNLQRLYRRREANCASDDPDRTLLRRARIDMDRLVPGFKKNPLGVPTVLLSGAFASTLVGVFQDAFGVFGSSSLAKVIATAALFLVAAVASWVILRGAAVAHRRIALTTDEPMTALYEVIGRAGDPPKDQAGLFAVLSIALVVLSLLVIPIGLTLTVFS